MTGLDYWSPRGECFELFGKTSGVFVEADTLDSLVGSFEDTRVQAVGASGTVSDLRDRVVHDIEGTLVVVVSDPQVWVKFRRAWSTRRYGQLRLRIADRPDQYLKVRLREALPFPAQAPRKGSRVSVSFVGGPVWQWQQAGTGIVTVTNTGDVTAYPKIMWEGAGGNIVLPSGAAFSLPPVSAERIIDLSRETAGLVFTADGAVDQEATKLIPAISEGIPVGESRMFKLPANARMETMIGVFDPWS